LRTTKIEHVPGGRIQFEIEGAPYGVTHLPV